MHRIDQIFARGTAAARLVFYLNAGDPTLASIPGLMTAMRDGGVDMIELGYPFCDPILDGPLLRNANRRALSAGGSLRQTLSCVAEFRQQEAEMPVVLMGYSNPVFHFGYERFAQCAGEAGIDGMIIADMPVDEAQTDLLPLLHGADIRYIPLGAPTLGADHIGKDLSAVGGFLYCVPAVGPTGGVGASTATVRREVARWRGLTTLPVGVGFGIKTAQDAAVIGNMADAVIVGTAFVEFVQQCWQQTHGDTSATCRLVSGFCREFRHALE